MSTRGIYFTIRSIYLTTRGIYFSHNPRTQPTNCPDHPRTLLAFCSTGPFPFPRLLAANYNLRGLFLAGSADHSADPLVTVVTLHCRSPLARVTRYSVASLPAEPAPAGPVPAQPAAPATNLPGVPPVEPGAADPLPLHPPPDDGISPDAELPAAPSTLPVSPRPRKRRSKTPVPVVPHPDGMLEVPGLVTRSRSRSLSPSPRVGDKRKGEDHAGGPSSKKKKPRV